MDTDPPTCIEELYARMETDRGWVTSAIAEKFYAKWANLIGIDTSLFKVKLMQPDGPPFDSAEFYKKQHKFNELFEQIYLGKFTASDEPKDSEYTN